MPNPLLDTDQLRTLVAIAETGSFTRAACEVHKTQSAVSMQMKRLEESVGRPLFSKNGRINQLTPDGEHLLEYARRIVTLNNEAFAVLTEPELEGHVRIGTPDDYAQRFLPAIFAAFARTHPLVEIEITCEGSSNLFERTQSGDVDLAIVTYGDGKSMGEVLRRERLLWVASPRHRVERRDVIPLALGPTTCSWRAAAVKALDGVNKSHRILYSSPSATALSAAVSSGLALSVFPESAIRPNMRLLGTSEGFPDLPDCEIALLRAPNASSSSIDALAEHIIASLSDLNPASLSWV